MRSETLAPFLHANSSILDWRSHTHLSSQAILDAAENVAQGLVQGASVNGPVIISHARAVDVIPALFGVWLSQRNAVLVSPHLSAHEQINVAQFTGATAWLGPMDLKTQAVLNANIEQEPGAGEPSQPGLVLLTSGTTGKPKGVQLSLPALVQRLALNTQAISTGNLRHTLCVLPAFFGHGLIGNCMTPLSAGCELVLMDSPTMEEIAGLGSVIDDHEISFMSSVPSFWKLATKLSKPPVRNSLKRVHVGSAPLSIDDGERIIEWCGTNQFFNMFGMTEAANWISGGQFDPSAPSGGFVGKPWGGSLGILNEDGTVSPQGRGEVVIQSPSMMDQYLGDEEATDAAFVAGWFRTGDIGDLNPATGLTLVGRQKWEINRGGIKVQAEEVDQLLEGHSDVLEACAFAVPDRVAGEAVAAAVQLHGGAGVSLEDIREWCRHRARPDAVPIWIVELDELAKNSRGKLDRLVIRESACAARQREKH